MLKIVMRIGLTYYDAAYATIAFKEDLTLVTDDEGLIKKIDNNRRAIIELLRRDAVVKSSEALINK